MSNKKKKKKKKNYSLPHTIKNNLFFINNNVYNSLTFYFIYRIMNI